MDRTKEREKEQVETIMELGRERQFLDVICRDYTTVHFVDLKNDVGEPLKVSMDANAAKISCIQIREHANFTEMIECYGNKYVCEKNRKEFLQVMKRENLVMELANKERFIYRYESVPNAQGHSHFEVQVVRVNTEFFDGRVILAFRHIDDIISQELKYQSELEHAAYTDALTDTRNRGAFRRELPLYEEGYPHAAIMVADINNLKLCNDRYGHKAGDRMIQDTAECIREAFADMGKCYRIGGDEFCVVMPNESQEHIEEALERMQMLLDQKNKTRNMMLSVACGYAVRKDESQNMEQIFNYADELMYEKKYIMKKEFPVYCEERIKNYLHVLEILSKSTSAYLFLWNIGRDEIYFFGDVDHEYALRKPGSNVNTTEEMVNIVYPQDQLDLKEDLQRIAEGKKKFHDMNYRWINRKGETVWISCRGSVICDDKGKPFVMIGRVSDEVWRHLYHPLTGMFNKQKLLQDLQTDILPKSRGYLMFLQLDRLGDINLKHGRTYGNQVIINCAHRMENIPNVEQIWHVGNHSFVLFLQMQTMEEVQEIYEDISRSIEDLCSATAGVVPIDASVFEDENNLFTCGEMVLERAKRNGIHNITFFSQEELNKRIWNVRFIGEIRDSIENGYEGFYLCYQPQIEMGSYHLHGAEALLRYHSPTQGEVYPDVFIPLLEDARIIHPIGMWVLKTALEQCRQWRQTIPDFCISVNFSPVQLMQPHAAEDVLEILKDSGLPGEALTIEITESTQLEKFQTYNTVFRKWNEAGISLSIDDFGTGYSNMGYLKKLDVDEIKIDRLFVSGLEEETYNYRLISNMIDFAKSNNIRICCEGVENEQEIHVLESLAPNLLQGYFFAKPCNTDVFEHRFIDHPIEFFKNDK